MARNTKTGNMRFQPQNKSGQRGFTLMELVIVMTVIAILVSVAVPVYITHVQCAKEVVLMNDLDEMRRAIDKYAADKEKAPQKLEDLVSFGYLRAVPKDPITQSADTWELEQETEPFRPGVPTGIANVRSGAEGNCKCGKENKTTFKEY